MYSKHPRRLAKSHPKLTAVLLPNLQRRINQILKYRGELWIIQLKTNNNKLYFVSKYRHFNSSSKMIKYLRDSVYFLKITQLGWDVGLVAGYRETSWRKSIAQFWLTERHKCHMRSTTINYYLFTCNLCVWDIIQCNLCRHFSSGFFFGVAGFFSCFFFVKLFYKSDLKWDSGWVGGGGKAPRKNHLQFLMQKIINWYVKWDWV